MRRSICGGVFFLLFSTAIAAAASTSFAADYNGDFHGDPHGDFHHDSRDFHGDFHHDFRDFDGRPGRHFRGPDAHHWANGHWLHDWHDGRFGWWWVVDGFWNFYPAPVYPYPAYGPPVVQTAPASPPAAVWYYCDNPQGYYPNVAVCSGPWRTVQAAPAPAPSQPPG